MCYVLIETVDAQGTVCPSADYQIAFNIEGPAEIAGIGNGNPQSMDSFTDREHRLFNGKAMLILRTSEQQAGPITVTATAEGLEAGKVEVRSRAVKDPTQTR